MDLAYCIYAAVIVTVAFGLLIHLSFDEFKEARQRRKR